jgi:hypothetical protein
MNLPMTVNKHLAVTLLHGWLCKSTSLFAANWAGPDRFGYGDRDVPLYKIWQAFDWLPMDQKAALHMYYLDGPKYIDLKPTSLLASAFTSGDGSHMLLVVSNLYDKPVHGATATLDLKGLGLKGDSALQAEDVVLGTPMPIRDGIITLDIKPERYRLLKLWRGKP